MKAGNDDDDDDGDDDDDDNDDDDSPCPCLFPCASDDSEEEEGIWGEME